MLTFMPPQYKCTHKVQDKSVLLATPGGCNLAWERIILMQTLRSDFGMGPGKV